MGVTASTVHSSRCAWNRNGSLSAKSVVILPEGIQVPTQIRRCNAACRTARVFAATVGIVRDTLGTPCPWVALQIHIQLSIRREGNTVDCCEASEIRGSTATRRAPVRGNAEQRRCVECPFRKGAQLSVPFRTWATAPGADPVEHPTSDPSRYINNVSVFDVVMSNPME